MATYNIYANSAPSTTGISMPGYGAVPGTITIANSNLGPTGATWTTVGYNGATSPSGMLTVSGNADIQGKLTVQGVEILEILSQIQQRLCILVPDPKLLDKYEALKQAYEHYKTLEALCVDFDNTKK